MKKYLFFIFLLTTCQLIHAQEFFTGKMKDGKLEKPVFYDRTQYPISIDVFQSIYKVMDNSKQLLYTITLTHDREKAMFFIAVKKTDAASRGTTIKYDPNYYGLIFSNTSNFDTSFNAATAYNYLVSFTDTSLTYPVLHKIKAEGNILVDLDPLNKLRIKKHTELVKQIPRDVIKSEKKALAATGNTGGDWMAVRNTSGVINPILDYPLNREIFELRDLFYVDNTDFEESISTIRKNVEARLSSNFKKSQLTKDEKHFVGDKGTKEKEGYGLLLSHGSAYDGSFKNAKFICGNTIIHTDTTQYYGEMSDDNLNGRGWLTYTNGSYQLGMFKDGKLTNGGMLWKEKNGDTYFGSIKNGRKTGYGEIRSTSGNVYYGEFANGRLVSGYGKEIDQFGYATYSRIEEGAKTAIDPQTGASFFDVLLNFKREPTVLARY